MRKHALRAMLVIGAWQAAQASAPGQPFDCSDWEILVPGVTCTNVGRPDGTSGYFGSDADTDGTGRLLRATLVPRPGFICGSNQYYWSTVQALENGVWIDLVRLSDRCLPGELMDVNCIVGSMAFDPIAGRLYFYVANNPGAAPSSRCTNGFGSTWIAAFDGFPRLLDLQKP